DVKEDRPLRFFVSYAHDDADLKAKLLGKLQMYLRTHSQARFELWTDGAILPGEKWLAEIRTALDVCDFGLLLVSPAFLASKFITREELPFLLQNKPVIPVALRRVLFDGTQDLKGLAERQIFRDEGGRAFSQRTTDNTREEFALQL